MTTKPLIQISHLTKDFRGGVRANDDISFSVDAGEVFGLLGHNGAGKTTLLNQIIGLVRPTAGTIHIAGFDAIAAPDTARELCSFQPQTQTPLDGLTPRQSIELMARIRGAGRRRSRERAAELLCALDMVAWADKVGDKLSGGVKRLAAFAMAAAQPGRVVMFDEPTNDVDPVRRRLLWRQVRALADAGCAVLLVTHNVIEAERAVDRLLILDDGRVVAHGTPAQLRGDPNLIRLEVVASDANVATTLVRRFGGAAAGRQLLTSIHRADVVAVIDHIQQLQSQGRVIEFSITPTSLEDVYIRLANPESAVLTEGADDAALAS